MVGLFKRTPKFAMGSREANEKTRAALGVLGDSGRPPRAIRHFATPGEREHLTSRATLTRDAAPRGFAVRETAYGGGLVFEHRGAVADPAFDAVTAEFAAWLDQRGWVYDGWECDVVSESRAER